MPVRFARKSCFGARGERREGAVEVIRFSEACFGENIFNREPQLFEPHVGLGHFVPVFDLAPGKDASCQEPDKEKN